MKWEKTRIFILSLMLLSGLNVNYNILLGSSEIIGRITTYFVYFTRGCVLICFLAFGDRRYHMIDIKYIFYFACIFLFNTLDEIKGSANFNEWFHRSFSMAYLLIFYLCVIRITKKHREELLNAMYFVSAFLLLDSLILYYLQPEIATYCENEGVYTLQGVAGNRNHVIEYWILETIGLFGSEKLCCNKKCQIFWVFTIYIQILTKSTTGMVVMAVVTFMLGIYRYARRFFKPVLFASYIMIFITYVVMVFNQNLMFKHFIVNVLHKTPTLTGRLMLWEARIGEIMKSPILGYGYDNALNGGAIDNAMIYLLLAGGVLGMMVWLFMLISAHSSVILKKFVRRTEAVWCIGILGYMVRGITEAIVSYPHIVFWCSLILLDMEKSNYRIKTVEEITRKYRKSVYMRRKCI